MPRHLPLLTAVLVLLSGLLSPLLVAAGGPLLTASPGGAKEATSPKATGPILHVQWPWDFFGRGGSEQDQSWYAPPPEVEHPSRRSERKKYRTSSSGTYRTLCVRLCDGFYFPISYATTRDRFSRDAGKCETGCPGRSRLFVHRTRDNVDDMTDLEGGTYRDLKNAFRYRQEYVADCTCRGHPWVAEAIARHRAYAEAAKG